MTVGAYFALSRQVPTARKIVSVVLLAQSSISVEPLPLISRRGFDPVRWSCLGVSSWWPPAGVTAQPQE